MIRRLIFVGYQLGGLATLIALMVKDWPSLNWWNWIIIIPINFFLAEIWPIYWLILRPIFGA